MTDAEILRNVAASLPIMFPEQDTSQVQVSLLRMADKIELCGCVGCWQREPDPRDGWMGEK